MRCRPNRRDVTWISGETISCGSQRIVILVCLLQHVRPLDEMPSSIGTRQPRELQLLVGTLKISECGEELSALSVVELACFLVTRRLGTMHGSTFPGR